jgi:proteasome lid subunit RPN8/RPN11
MLNITQSVANQIAEEAERAYPDECVGLLLGTLEGTTKTASAVFPVENSWSGQVKLANSDDPDSRRERFYLDPRDYMRADKAARAQGLDVIGVYHSHPDHPAKPSDRDLVGAQGAGGPGFSFAIQSVVEGRAAEFRSWILSTDGEHFEAETCLVYTD